MAHLTKYADIEVAAVTADHRANMRERFKSVNGLRCIMAFDDHNYDPGLPTLTHEQVRNLIKTNPKWGQTI